MTQPTAGRSRLSDRVQRSRRHRQWVATATSSGSSTSTPTNASAAAPPPTSNNNAPPAKPSPAPLARSRSRIPPPTVVTSNNSASPPKKASPAPLARSRSRIERAAANYQRHKRNSAKSISPKNAEASSIKTFTCDKSTTSNTEKEHTPLETNDEEKVVAMTIPSKPATSMPEDDQPRSKVKEPTTNNSVDNATAANRRLKSAAETFKRNIQQTKEQQNEDNAVQKQEALESSEATTKSAMSSPSQVTPTIDRTPSNISSKPESESRTENNEEDDMKSVGSRSWKHRPVSASVTKRYAPWEKKAEENEKPSNRVLHTMNGKDDSSEFTPAREPSSPGAGSETFSSNNVEDDMKSVGSRSWKRPGSVGKRYAPWEKKPDEPEKPRYQTPKNNVNDKDDNSEYTPAREPSSSDARSEVFHSNNVEDDMKSVGSRSWKRPGSVGKRYAPWEKKPEEQKANLSNETPHVSKEKVAPWQKPPSANEELTSGVKEISNSSSADNATKKDAVGDAESGANDGDLRKPADEESKDTEILAPWQKELKLRKSRNISKAKSGLRPTPEMNDESKPRNASTPSWVRPSPEVQPSWRKKEQLSSSYKIPETEEKKEDDSTLDDDMKSVASAVSTTSVRRGKVQTPSWLRPSPNTPDRWKKPQPTVPRASNRDDTEERQGDSNVAEQEVNPNSNSDRITPTIGGAVIETPKVMSVASLRASLGSKPTPPPLPGQKHSGAEKSSPWRLAGNRSAANRFDSPYSNHLPGKLPKPPRNDEVHDTAPPDGVESQSSRQHIRTPTTEPATKKDLEADDSPTKSLAEMAADSVLITDLSKISLDRQNVEDEDSVLSETAENTTPARDELPTEFQNILPDEQSQTSQEERDRSVLSPKALSYHNYLTSGQDKTPVDISNERLHSMCQTQSNQRGNDGSETAVSSSLQGLSIVDRAQALQSWSDTRNMPPSQSVHTPYSQSTERSEDNRNYASKSIAQSSSVRARAESFERQNHGHQDKVGNSSTSTQMLRGSSYSSRVNKFFDSQANSNDGEEDSRWASRDPEDEVMLNHSESPESVKSQKENTMMNFHPDPDDPFYHISTTDKHRQQESLDPEDVFGDADWAIDINASNANVEESLDFCEDSFFVDDSSGMETNQSPFRVISLKPPRKTPATRSRRQLEASRDFGSSKYAQASDEWNL